MNIFPAVLLSAVCAASLGHAGVVSIPALKDTTLYESGEAAVANGAGGYVFAGRTREQSEYLRRAVFEFDIQSAVPANAVINSATLTLHMSNSRAESGTFAIHRLTREWTEGTTNVPGNGGGGAFPATGGDATWLFATSPDVAWTGPGAAGDFIGAPSASTLVGGPAGFYSWTGMVDDVQLWLGNSAANHGWILMGEETVFGSAIRFESRNSPTEENRPVLIVDFTVVPEPAAPGMACAALLALCGRRRR